MILTHGANSLSRDSGETVTIGGRKYRTVTIGGQTWLAENLDLKFDGLAFGQDGADAYEPRGNYYQNDSLSYGKYGILYNWSAVKYLENHKSNLIPGWHVPTIDEWTALAAAVGGVPVAGRKLKSTTDWSSGAGTDDYGFSALPTGYYDVMFHQFGTYTGFWTAQQINASYAHINYFDTSAYMNTGSRGKSDQLSVRLVKDA